MKLPDRHEFVWGSSYGQRKTLAELDDNHVLNIYGWLPTSYLIGYADQYDLMERLIDREIEIRGLKFFKSLKRMKLMDMQVSHRDPEGNKRVWCTKEKRPVLVED